MKEDRSTTGLNKAVTHTRGERGNPSLRRTSTALWWSADRAVSRSPARFGSLAHVSSATDTSVRPPRAVRKNERLIGANGSHPIAVPTDV